ncbi:hypothetical protein M0R45_031166 [Rubus argutus]|uniref:Uncharacterized protein n=1 Tax=Rubus argutus TaxID=59490 RepID=A0AAW1WFN6_RUBAR
METRCSLTTATQAEDIGMRNLGIVNSLWLDLHLNCSITISCSITLHLNAHIIKKKLLVSSIRLISSTLDHSTNEKVQFFILITYSLTIIFRAASGKGSAQALGSLPQEAGLPHLGIDGKISAAA